MSQLYRVYDNVLIPYMVDLSAKRNRQLKTRLYETYCLMFWPNGKPCTPVNAWLASIASTTTGRESTKTAASEISPLVRYCYATAESFDLFSDSDLYKLKKILLDEKKLIKGVLGKAREINQVRSILQCSLKFLMWYEGNIRPRTLPSMVGAGRGAQLTVTQKFNPRNNSYYFSHTEIPALSAPSNDKQPLPASHISCIQDEIFKCSVSPDNKQTSKSPLNYRIYREARTAYLYNRRMFMVWLMEFCGLRPEEMQEMPLEANRRPFKTSVIVLPTKKTRQLPTPVRKLPINSDDAAELSSYLNARDEFVRLLINYSKLKADPGMMFLSELGTSISKQSLARDFKRISEYAGLTNVRVCLSMFRHLFITRQMIYYIQSEIDQAIKTSSKKPTADELYLSLRNNDAFVLKICRKIIPLTGHRSPSSVITYFHDAMNTLGRFLASDRDVKDINTMHSSMNSLVRIRHEAIRGNNTEIVRKIDEIKLEWERLRLSRTEIQSDPT